MAARRSQLSVTDTLKPAPAGFFMSFLKANTKFREWLNLKAAALVLQKRASLLIKFPASFFGLIHFA